MILLFMLLLALFCNILILFIIFCEWFYFFRRRVLVLCGLTLEFKSVVVEVTIPSFQDGNELPKRKNRRDRQTMPVRP